MRKFISLCLSLVLLVTLSVSALADTEPPLWQQVGYESLAACLEEEEITEAQYNALAEQAAGFDAYAYYTEEYALDYAGFSAQDYMEYWKVDEAVFIQTMLEDWFSNQTYELWRQNYQEELRRQQAAARDKAIQAAGGVPGQVNVMLNGKCLSFGKAAPEITGGRTMVPMRAILEALGAEVAYDESTRTASVTMGDIALTHVIGETTITTGAGETLQMKAASYIKSGRTMVPLRFFSEALGYDVFWDANYRTAVLIDKDAWIKEADSHFTILNDFIQKQYTAFDADKNLESKASISGNVTVYDTIQGNRQHKLNIALTTLMGKDAVNVSGEMDLSLLAKLLEELSEEELPAWVNELMGKFTFRYIGSEKGSWFNAPELTDALRKEGHELPKGDVWFKAHGGANLDDFYMALGLLRSQMQEMTIGKLLYQVITADDTSSFTYCRDLEQSLKAADVLIGDKTFTKSGSSYRWKLDQETVNKRSKELSELFLTESIDFPMTLEMTLKADGSCTFSMKGVFEKNGTIVVQFSLSAESSPTKGNMTAKIQIMNTCDIDLKVESSVRATDKTPDAQPPANAVIVDEDYTPMPLPA